jgi:hypothetical protein
MHFFYLYLPLLTLLELNPYSYFPNITLYLVIDHLSTLASSSILNIIISKKGKGGGRLYKLGLCYKGASTY